VTSSIYGRISRTFFVCHCFHVSIWNSDFGRYKKSLRYTCTTKRRLIENITCCVMSLMEVLQIDYLTTLSHLWSYIQSNGMTEWIGKDSEWNGRGLFQGTTSDFAWKAREIQQHPACPVLGPRFEAATSWIQVRHVTAYLICLVAN
jgi:hypothetical protein